MSATDTTRYIHCPKCAARFEIAPSMAGRRARCSVCETGFEIPAMEEPESDPSLPEFISVDCRVCGTRLTGRSAYIGKKIKCPDCGAGTELPPPPPPKPRNMPAALEGEQYELWDPDDQPLPSQIAAAQPHYVDVVCDKCGTLMHANEIQAGQKISCPDCGTKTTIPFKPRPVKKKSVLTADRDTPQIDPAAIPGDVPFIMPKTQGLTLAEQEAKDEYERALEKSRRTGRPMEIDERGRPIMPTYPLITGVLPFLFTSGVPGVWLGLSLAFCGSLAILLYGLQMAFAGNFGAFLGMILFAIGLVLTMVAMAAAFSCLMQIVMESANGNRRVLSWPGFMDWFASLIYLVIAGMISAIPGWAISQIPAVSSSPALAQFLMIGSIAFCFPLILLSQLDHDTPLGVLSGRILRSLTVCPFSWALFYVECIVIVAICVTVTAIVSGGILGLRSLFNQGLQTGFIDRPLAVIWLAPVFMLAAIILARLLGRLGWKLAEAMPDDDQPKSDDNGLLPPGPKNYNPPRSGAPAT